MKFNNLINVYKNKRKQAIINNISPDFSYKYAFVGVGQHSLSTFYPILIYLNTPVKYIFTEKSHYATQMALKFPNAKATHDYEEILADPEVKGLFICGNPANHFQLTSKALLHNKDVFVEKPVCFKYEELKELISICKSYCVVGLQKRFSTINTILKKNYSNPVYYSSRYAIGAYPEGNALINLFIHPIDNLIYLFGKANIVYHTKIQNKNNVIYLLHLKHENGIIGTLELSTDHNWSMPIDTLRLELLNETVLIHYPGYIESTPKEKNILGIPFNKILQKPITKKIIYNNNGSLHIEKNILFEAGFFNEVKDFIAFVEGNESSKMPKNSIHQLINTYELLDYLEKK